MKEKLIDREQIRKKSPFLQTKFGGWLTKLAMFDKTLNCLHINPGAAGKQGFHRKRTILRFSIGEGNIFDLEVIELND